MCFLEGEWVVGGKGFEGSVFILIAQRIRKDNCKKDKYITVYSHHGILYGTQNKWSIYVDKKRPSYFSDFVLITHTHCSAPKACKWSLWQGALWDFCWRKKNPISHLGNNEFLAIRWDLSVYPPITIIHRGIQSVPNYLPFLSKSQRLKTNPPKPQKIAKAIRKKSTSHNSHVSRCSKLISKC